MNQNETVIPPPFPNSELAQPRLKKDRLYEAFVGKKYQSYYQSKFKGLEERRPKGGFNIAAFF